MFEFLKSKTFDIVFSFLLGLGVMSLFRKACEGPSCIIQKAPPVDEVMRTTYQIGSECQQFKTKPIECPKEGVIEPFQEIHHR